MTLFVSLLLSEDRSPGLQAYLCLTLLLNFEFVYFGKIAELNLIPR